MMEAAPASALEMPEPDFLLEIAIVALDAPTQLGEIDETGKADGLRQGGEPVFRRLLFALGPFDEQPFFRPGFAALAVAPGDADTKARWFPRARSSSPRLRREGSWSGL